jgi:AraC-like DNA-binding protein
VSDDPHVVAPRLAAIAAELVNARPPDRVVQAATVRLRDSRVRVDRLADELGFSERQLRRRFDDAVGYGPKTLQRVLRLGQFLAASGLLARSTHALDSQGPAFHPPGVSSAIARETPNARWLSDKPTSAPTSCGFATRS